MKCKETRMRISQTLSFYLEKKKKILRGGLHINFQSNLTLYITEYPSSSQFFQAHKFFCFLSTSIGFGDTW